MTAGDWAALDGALLAFRVHGVTAVECRGDRGAVVADVHVLDGPHKGSVDLEVPIAARLLRNQLAASAGSAVLGRLRKAPAKPGQSPSWVLRAVTPEDRAAGLRWSRDHGGAV
ncbi:hypothetical protein DQ244_17255 [Blastococcus sp. TBT05-19]|nr:hypothetical protein DQ244_17255 [Blastococcus sp. TBT05-19]